MAMRKALAAAHPDAYVNALRGWQRGCVERLRSAVRRAKSLDEMVKWGHLVYFANGPVALIRAEETRVLFGFGRGQRLIDIEPKLKPGGKYEMATIEIADGAAFSAAKAARLITGAIQLNQKLGDPAKAAPKRKSRAS